VRFWDTSALVPLIVNEPGTELVMAWLEEDPVVVIWGLTRVELASAIERRAREGRLDRTARTSALRRAERLANDAHEVLDVSAVRVRALPLLARHAIRAADSAQLGAALLVADPDPASVLMVVLDRRLAAAAEREGMGVLGWP
jgi:predicted nucleic acid-binding protein